MRTEHLPLHVLETGDTVSEGFKVLKANNYHTFIHYWAPSCAYDPCSPGVYNLVAEDR